MNSLVWLYSMSITSILSLIYALFSGEWIGVFCALVLWICIGVWFLVQLKPNKVPHG